MKYAFIDRDGTLIQEPHDEQVDALEKVRLVPFVIQSLQRLQAAGYVLVMVTNQDGLGTQSFPQADFDAPHRHMLDIFSSQGITFEEVLICPHRPADHCSCRKPQVGLVQGYLGSHMDRKHSFVVGDRSSDAELAKNMGIEGYVLGPELGWDDIISVVLDAPRRAARTRRTSETGIRVEVNLDGTGVAAIHTGIGFFDHMLEQVARHADMDIRIEAEGDLHVDDHHLVEDVGIVLGHTVAEALGDKRGIGRYGFVLPMDEAQAQVSLDICGRAFFKFKGVFVRDALGALSTELIPHFWRSFAHALGATLHIEMAGENAHHQAEAVFKGVARCLRQAITRNAGTATILPSTKGVL